MIPFLAPLLLKLSPVGRVLKAIPRPVWIALAVLAALGGLYWYHADAVSDARESGYTQGKTDEGARIAARAREIERKANAASSKITKALKDRNDEENRAIAGRADDLRLSGPGKAACPGRSRLPGPASGPVAAGGRTDAPRPEMPSGDRAAVPWGWLVSRAEQCDLNRAEVLSWREWWSRQNEAWKAIEHK